MKMICLISLLLLFHLLNLQAKEPADTNWRDVFKHVYTIAPPPTCVLADSSGIYIGGVSLVGFSDTVNSLAKWDGQNWNALCDSNGKNGVNGMINCMVKEGNNLYVAGFFDTAGSVYAKNIARWDGSNWFSLGKGINGNIMALAIKNGILYAGGTFDSAGNINANKIAKWDGQNWNSLGNGIHSEKIDSNDASMIWSIALDDSGKVFVGGTFDSAGTIKANNISMWQDSNWYALQNGLFPDSNYFSSGPIVNSLISNGTDLFVGGCFNRSDSISLNGIAKWDGFEWIALDAGLKDGICYSLAKMNNAIYVAGDFDSVGTIYASSIAKWENNNWEPLGSGIQYGVNSISTYNNILIAVGSFFSAGDTVFCQFIAFWSVNEIPELLFSNVTENIPNISIICYPIPADNYVHLKYNLFENSLISFSIFNNNGLIIYEKEKRIENCGENELIWNTENIPSGAYFCKIMVGEKSIIQKIILQK